MYSRLLIVLSAVFVLIACSKDAPGTILGCTDVNSSNYMYWADEMNIDDCPTFGCMDTTAENFDPNANVDSGCYFRSKIVVNYSSASESVMTGQHSSGMDYSSTVYYEMSWLDRSTDFTSSTWHSNSTCDSYSNYLPDFYIYDSPEKQVKVNYRIYQTYWNINESQHDTIVRWLGSDTLDLSDECYQFSLPNL